MTKADNKLPDWISQQASLGANVNVNGKMNKSNTFWYLLAACCPQIFDSYAIILHPFWINWKIKNLIGPGLTIKEEQTDDADFTRVSWKEFFQMYGRSFKLETANNVHEELSKELSKEGWPVDTSFPGEGGCEKEELAFVKSHIQNLFGNQPVNYYYCFLKTRKTEDIVYKGNLQELEDLWKKDEVNGSPTAIYPDSQDWCIVTDYDLYFTYVGGSKELIDKITSGDQFEIFRLNPTFKVRVV